MAVGALADRIKRIQAMLLNLRAGCYIRNNELKMDIRMTNRTVENFAISLDVTPQALLDLLKSAGVAKESFEDHLSDADKQQLRDYLIKTRTSSGVVSAPKLTRVS